MAKEQLAGSDIAGSLVDQRDLRTAQAVRIEGRRVQADQGDPTVYQPTIMARRKMLPKPTPAWKQTVTGSQLARSPPSRESLARRRGDLERDRPAGLALADGRSETYGVAQVDVAHAQADEITPAQLAVDGKVEQGKVSRTVGELEARAQGPDVFGFSCGVGPTICPRLKGTRVLVGTVTTSGMTGSWVEELVMRNPMLPFSPTSNDGSLQHKPTLAPAGLHCCSHPPRGHSTRFRRRSGWSGKLPVQFWAPDGQKLTLKVSAMPLGRRLPASDCEGPKHRRWSGWA